ncbi:MAG: hypothetical protein L3K24_12785 [Gammaproteobacteria bacterium]|nr:hypothetical protein [Gammaproteobacteria bacterium]
MRRHELTDSGLIQTVNRRNAETTFAAETYSAWVGLRQSVVVKIEREVNNETVI